jgi:WD40 repeat protein
MVRFRYLTHRSSMIHSFSPSEDHISPVTALTQSPAIDVIGVGREDGSISVFDIRQGDEIMQMKADDGSVTALSFRMGMKAPYSPKSRWTTYIGFLILGWLHS